MSIRIKKFPTDNCRIVAFYPGARAKRNSKEEEKLYALPLQIEKPFDF